jgi:hypothetical protein
VVHPADEYHRLIGRCEQVAMDGYLLRQVLSASQLAPGAFFVDVTHQTLLVWDNGSRDLNKTHVAWRTTTRRALPTCSSWISGSVRKP